MTGILSRDRERFRSHLNRRRSDPVVAAARALARRHAIVPHLGSTAVDAGDGMAANRAFLFGPDGETIETYDKIHMFDVDLDGGESWRESATYVPGTVRGSPTCALPTARRGSASRSATTCALSRALPGRGAGRAEVLTAPAAFTRQTGEAHWHVLLRARAIENNCFMIAAAQGGRHEDGRETFGHSLISDPWGRSSPR